MARTDGARPVVPAADRGASGPGAGSPVAGRRLAVDVGRRRIGIAVADALGLTVNPRPVIPAGPGAAERLVAVIEAEAAVEVVVGMPWQADGSETGEACAMVREFLAAFAAARAARGLDVSVVLYDESYTSQTAAACALAAGVKRRRRQQPQDSLAAAVLLREYLAHLANLASRAAGDAGSASIAPGPASAPDRGRSGG